MVPSQWSERKRQKIAAFDPNGIGHPNGNLFGLPFTLDECAVVIIPVPWDVTASFRSGAALGPRAILEASYQIDLRDPVLPNAWQHGIAMLPMPEHWEIRGTRLRKLAETCIQHLEQGGTPDDGPLATAWREVNGAGAELNDWVRGKARTFLWGEKRLVGVVGGDHAVPLGLMEALADRYPAYGILHIDAHLDLRKAYEGFTYSHASIMRNAMEIPQISRIVHVGVRDYCDEEATVVEQSGGRLVAFTDREMKRELFAGRSWSSICQKILALLPPQVYVSFDIDGLNPSLCPHTGTPVPGGLEFRRNVLPARGSRPARLPDHRV